MLRFTIRDNEGSAMFGTERVLNWEAIKLAMTRNETYRGLMRKFTADFDFCKDIRTRLIRIFDVYGPEAEVYLTVEKGDAAGSRKSFSIIGGGELKADTTTVERSELGIKMAFVASGFEEKLTNRADNEAQYNTHVSVDGEVIPTFTQRRWNGWFWYVDATETRLLSMPDRVLELNSMLDIMSFGGAALMFPTGTSQHTYFMPVPMVVNFTADKDDIKTVTPTIAETNNNDPESFFFLQAVEAKTLNVEYNVNTVIGFNNSGGYTFSVKLWKRKVDADYATISETLISTWVPFPESPGLGHTGMISVPIVYVASVVETFNEGESMQLVMEILTNQGLTTGTSFGIVSTTENNSAITINSKSYYPATTAQAILPHELFSRYISIVTGSQTPFYSEIFGRVELGYAADGEWAYLAALNGLMIRGFTMDDAKFATSFKDIFQSYKAIGNLGLTIERLQDGTERVRIDKYEDLFSSEVVVDLGELVSGVTMGYNKSMLFSELIVGYNNQEYEELNGLGAFNGKFNFTSPLKSVSTKLDLTCKFRTDDYGIELARRKQYKDNPTEDTRYDEHIFLIDCKPDGYNLAVVQNEDFAEVTGILNPETAYNLRLSPGRNLRRWGAVIRAAMPGGGTLKFGDGAKNTDLVTRLTTETVSITEKADVDVSTLAMPSYTYDLIMINEAPLTKAQWLAIESNPLGLVKFRNKGISLFGYIDDASYNVNNKTAELTLIRANK